MGKICWHVNKTKHNKAQTVCIILGIHTNSDTALSQKRKSRQDDCLGRHWGPSFNVWSDEQGSHADDLSVSESKFKE